MNSQSLDFKNKAKKVLCSLLCVTIYSPAQAETKENYKRDVAIWYEAFDSHNPKLLDKILSEGWYEIPAEKREGRELAKKLLVQLTTTFPDFRISIDDIIQEGNKVVVRSTITGTQKLEFAGFPPKGRKINIQAIDIHEFKNGKIERTWHSEDWMTGLRQLGVFEK